MGEGHEMGGKFFGCLPEEIGLNPRVKRLDKSMSGIFGPARRTKDKQKAIQTLKR